MEVSFREEIASLRLGEGETFRGEGILAVTKALLQSGVSYVGGYQGAPVSHLMDVLLQSEDLLQELGVHLQTCTGEAAAAAMLGASVVYPMRGAVTWKAIVGTNVAADALSNLSSPGVIGGALIVVGEDYGEGASVAQERSHAFALKSSLILLDPRPDLPTIVRMVEQGFALSEASNTPAMLELRIRACHVFGSFVAKDNRRAPVSFRNPAVPARFDYGRLAHPPVTFPQEADKVSRRLPAARRYILEHGLNETLGPTEGELGIIVQGGLFNALNAELAAMGLSDAFGRLCIPTLVLNVTHPLVPEQIAGFCAGKRGVLVLEEGAPDYIEQAIAQILRKADLNTPLHGKDFLPLAGEYAPPVIAAGLAQFLDRYGQRFVAISSLAPAAAGAAKAAIGASLPPRAPTFCTGCPERPVFSAMKLLRQETGPVHVAADIGCHAFATFAPFHQGNTILGYGMSLASAAAVAGTNQRRPIAVMGDGGFWHNGLNTGVAGAVFNRDDAVLVVMDNGYSSATGLQDIPSSREASGEGRGKAVPVERAIKGVGATWVRTVHTYDVRGVLRTLKDALSDPVKGLKVIVARGECMLARQKRLRPAQAKAIAAGTRVVQSRFGVDPEVCTGDHACIRLNGCPSLTLKPSGDLLKDDPVAHVNNDCVGCGLCGEVAHAAQLCPSFYRLDVIRNPGWLDIWRLRVGNWLLRLLGGTPITEAPPLRPPAAVPVPAE
ncbi:indolepyruvate ferredoxin oxidoreductase subunit alpha [Roseomonas sp. AR75]|uniref:indolepyruvate ferredoxin oxidoreductase subunit alpha n=1 Tax=Roseomonas sp. AR75 TaxID=2562311 RepID=UPI0010C0D7D6|nr:indolepyruvate ferredoxin oxidoreductase subunit alpha [Roseomonas sp. AR75]